MYIVCANFNSLLPACINWKYGQNMTFLALCFISINTPGTNVYIHRSTEWIWVCKYNVVFSMLLIILPNSVFHGSSKNFVYAHFLLHLQDLVVTTKNQTTTTMDPQMPVDILLMAPLREVVLLDLQGVMEI